MTNFPTITGHKLIKVLSKLGYKVIRQKGSHAFIRNEHGKCNVIPLHKGCDLGIGLLRKILKDLDISVNDFLKLLQK